MREAINTVRIEGILLEKEITPRTIKKNNTQSPALSAKVIIRTTQKIDGKEYTVDIPVNFFAAKLKKDGNLNPGYSAIEDFEKLKSVAEVGKESASIVRTYGAKLDIQEYPDRNGQIKNSIHISAYSLYEINKTTAELNASFDLEFVVGSKTWEKDKNGDETGRMLVKGIVPGYGDRIQIVPMVSSNENVASNISEYWQEGDTVKATGKFYFVTISEKYTVPVDFGEAEEKTRTITKKELIITGGTQEPEDEDVAFAREDIEKALAERKERIEDLKQKRAESKTLKSSTSQIDLGF